MAHRQSQYGFKEYAVFASSPACSRVLTSERAWSELQESVRTALKTYSNIHRGTGLYSKVTTELFKEARETFLEYYGFSGTDHYCVIGTSLSTGFLKKHLGQPSREGFSEDFGLFFDIAVLIYQKSTVWWGNIGLLGQRDPLFMGGQ